MCGQAFFISFLLPFVFYFCLVFLTLYVFSFFMKHIIIFINENHKNDNMIPTKAVTHNATAVCPSNHNLCMLHMV